MQPIRMRTSEGRLRVPITQGVLIDLWFLSFLIRPLLPDCWCQGAAVVSTTHSAEAT